MRKWFQRVRDRFRERPVWRVVSHRAVKFHDYTDLSYRSRSTYYWHAVYLAVTKGGVVRHENQLH